ncbi:hypothetical protein ElyMa_006353900 [Elysia marginata]|uniref:Uncharacterized protein n=1 Tax=Elysia marginata TaxID=1093978 RepID=A0AAV4HPF6_9GAST|nr:hypothetical protein ElyMa_006353900 [Elysia marginata]
MTETIGHEHTAPGQYPALQRQQIKQLGYIRKKPPPDHNCQYDQTVVFFSTAPKLLYLFPLLGWTRAGRSMFVALRETRGWHDRGLVSLSYITQDILSLKKGYYNYCRLVEC